MSKRGSTRSQGPRQLSIEALEARTLLAVFNVPAQMSLAAAISTADSNTDAQNTINLAPGTYAATELVITPNPAVPTASGGSAPQTLSIVGQAASVVLQSNGSNRVLELNGNVVLENLTIEGGKVQAPAKTDAKGGGVLIDAGNVTLINVQVSNNSVRVR